MSDGAQDTRYAARLIALNDRRISAENEHYGGVFAAFGGFPIVFRLISPKKADRSRFIQQVQATRQRTACGHAGSFRDRISRSSTSKVGID
jgi:hypothetical protein